MYKSLLNSISEKIIFAIKPMKNIIPETVLINVVDLGLSLIFTANDKVRVIDMKIILPITNSILLLPSKKL